MDKDNRQTSNLNSTLAPIKQAGNIAVPLVSKTLSELEQDWQNAAKLKPQLIEWRLDLFELEDPEKIRTLGKNLKQRHQIPLLCTYRTSIEQEQLTDPQKHQLYTESLATNYLEKADYYLDFADLIDLEYRLLVYAKNNSILVKKFFHLLKKISKLNKILVLSLHDFRKSEQSKTVILHKVRKMQDFIENMCQCSLVTRKREDDRFEQEKLRYIIKYAFTPANEETTLNLLAVIEELGSLGEFPFVLLAMGENGTSSRKGKHALMNAFTFALVDEAKNSAPGQITIRELRESWLNIS